MSGEFVSVNVGEAGIELGNTVWKQYCKEHKIDHSGSQKETCDDHILSSFFQQNKSNQLTLRNLMIDLDPHIIDEIKQSKYTKLYNAECLLCSNQDSGTNFARGYCHLGHSMMNKINDRLRKLSDNCDDLKGFIFNRSVGGGTGSGLGSLILQKINDDYKKKVKYSFEIYPFDNHHSNCIVEPYNALLATHWSLDYTEVSFIFDNRKIYSLCENCLCIDMPAYNDMNMLLAKMESSITSQFRFEHYLSINDGEQNNELHIHLVPFPRLHFITSSMAPIINNSEKDKVIIAENFKFTQMLVDGFVRCNYRYYNENMNIELLKYEPPLYQELMQLIYKAYTDKFQIYSKQYYFLNDINDLFEMCCSAKYFFVECDDYNPKSIHTIRWRIRQGIKNTADQSMACLINCHGMFNDNDKDEIIAAMKSIQKNKKISYVDWCPNDFKIEMHKNQMASMEKDVVACRDRAITMCVNNTLMNRFFKKRITDKFDVMFQQRAYVHWYINEGMEESELVEAREDLGFLEKDYEDVLADQLTDDDW